MPQTNLKRFEINSELEIKFWDSSLAFFSLTLSFSDSQVIVCVRT